MNSPAAMLEIRLIVRAAHTLAAAAWVGGSLFISIDHEDGVRTTYSWLSGLSVRKGDQVAREQSIGFTGQGHPGSSTTHLHFGARVGSTYIDPMLLLERGAVAGMIHLAPLIDPGERPIGQWSPGWTGTGPGFGEILTPIRSGYQIPIGIPAPPAPGRRSGSEGGPGGPRPRGPPLQ